MSYTDLTIKKLYGRSYNECNNPDCDQIVIEIDPNTGRYVNHGKIAHIRGRRPGSERYRDNYPKEKLNDEENLILLCQVHHDIVDQKGAEEFYSIELLESWKSTHYQNKEIYPDREWVYGANNIIYKIEGVQYQLSYWHDKNGNTRFFTPDQLKQSLNAYRLSGTLRDINFIISTIENANVTPADPSNITKNDSYIQILKKKLVEMRRVNDGIGAMERIYTYLKTCDDITLSELSLIGSKEKLPQNTIFLADNIDQNLIVKAMQRTQKKEPPKD